MTLDDVDVLAGLDAQCFDEDDAWDREDFLFAAESPDSEFIVAELDGKIIACAGVEFFFDNAELQTIAVAPNYRGKGIGQKLLLRLFGAVINHGLAMMILEVRPSNTSAIKLYEKFGFQVVDCLEDFYGNEDALVMLRNL